ncbi:glycosyltransferase [Agromyces soli]|uniref:glycosyltransferase n=1 Tax=Agromyces soli TaxID=659012 RepID=UPI0031D6BE9F
MTSDLEEQVLGVRCVRWNPERADEEGRTAPVSNFGDLLGPLVIRRIVETRRIRFASSASRRLLSVGSVMHFANPGDVVWGTGVNGKIGTQPLPPSLDVRAVRGPLTRAVLTARGIEAPEVFGDPALLLPELWPELVRRPRPKRRALTVVPNLNETARFAPALSRSPIGDPWAIIDDLAASEFVTGTSLHALVVADALGIPSRPIAPENESTFKYLDYYAGTGRSDVRFAHTVEEALELGPVPAPEFDAAALLAAFPIDLWAGTGAPRPSRSRSYLELRADSLAQRTALRAALGAPVPDADAELDEAGSAIERLEMLSLRNPPLEGLTDEERRAIGAAPVRASAPGDDAGGPLLSVVIPSHDVRPWIGETLDSVLAQDLDLEVLIVDDHSTDGTRALLDALAAADPRIRVIDAVTRGGGTARNIGSDHARGRYLAFCDGDDLVAPGAYRALVDSLEASGSDIAFGDYLKFSPTRTWSPTQNWPAFRAARRGIRVQDEPSLLNGRPCWNKVFRRSFWARTELSFPDVPRSNDIVPMVRSYLAADAVDIVEDVVYLYRERPGLGSMTSRAKSADSLISYLTQEIVCARLISAASSPELTRVYRTLILDRDGWVHLARYLRADRGDHGRDAEIVGLVRELVAELGIDRPNARDRQKAAVFELLLAGRIDLAAAAAVVCDDDAAPDARLFESWRTIAEHDAADDAALLAEPVFSSRLCAALVAGVHAADDSADVALLGAVGAVATSRPELLRAVPEFADAANSSAEELRARLRATRARAAELVAVSSGRSIGLQVDGNVAAADLAALYDESSGRVVARAPTRPAQHGPGVRSRLAGRRLPMAVRLRAVLVDPETGWAMSLRFAASTPEYSPFDRFLLHFDRRGVLVERRPGWLPRAGRRGVRGLLRRLRGTPKG